MRPLLNDPLSWSRESRLAVENIVRILRLAVITARDRIYNLGLTAEVWFLERNRLLQKIKDQDRELQIHRSRIEHLKPSAVLITKSMNGAPSWT